MMIKTVNEQGADQWWKLFYDKGFIYIDHHRYKESIERELESHLFTIDYNQIRLAALQGTGDDESINWSFFRGEKSDQNPFVIRGKVLGPIYMRIRKYQNQITGWVSKASEVDKWNFTDKQRAHIFNHYFPQIKAVIDVPGWEQQMKIYHTRKVKEHLLKQIEEQRALLSAMEEVVKSEKFNV